MKIKKEQKEKFHFSESIFLSYCLVLKTPSNFEILFCYKKSKQTRMTKFITSVAFLDKITNYLLEITRTILPKSSAAVNKFYIIEHSSVIHTTTKSHFVK